MAGICCSICIVRMRFFWRRLQIFLLLHMYSKAVDVYQVPHVYTKRCTCPSYAVNNTLHVKNTLHVNNMLQTFTICCRYLPNDTAFYYFLQMLTICCRCYLCIYAEVCHMEHMFILCCRFFSYAAYVIIYCSC